MGQPVEGGKYFEPQIQCPNLDAVIRIVSASNAVSIAIEPKLKPWVAAGQVAIVPFHAPWFKTNYAIMHLRERTLAPAAVAFCAEAHEAERRYNEPSGPPDKKHGRGRS